MSAMKAAAPPPRSKDRFGLRRARAGRVRGQIANVRRSFEIGEFGNLIVMDFDLVTDPGAPPTPVRMTGTIFNREPQEGMLVEVRDPDPSVRPILTHRLDFPPHYHFEIVGFYPGRDDLSPGRQRLIGAVVVVGPLVIAAVLIGLFYLADR